MTQQLEGVPFGYAAFYDALHYETISSKLKNCQSGLKWFTLTRHTPTRSFNLRIHPKTKRMNEFTFAGVRTCVPIAGSQHQFHLTTDTTNIPHVQVSMRIRYNEWNENFFHEKL